MRVISYIRRLMKEAFYISVILPLKLEWEPCYRLPDIYASEDVVAGDRVKVPFAGRTYSGVVSRTGITPETSTDKIKDVIELESGLSRIFEEEISLWKKVAEYYLCTVGEVYRAAYPTSKINLEEAHASAVEKARLRREKILEGMRSKVSRLEERIEKKQALYDKAGAHTKTKERLKDDLSRLKNELNLAQEALLNAETRNTGHNSQDQADAGMQPEAITLSNAQSLAYQQIQDAFKERKPVLLHGVTGSGKTEIYLKLAKEVLDKGKNVLYLVPEIALSRQLEDRLHRHFNDRLHVFHSAETAASRRNTNEAVRSGDGYIVLGTRSALFMPHHNLGLVIVDEEHDSSYKQDSPAPRYNGRDTALMLSVIHQSDIIMGSATPSLEESYNCLTGRHHIVRLEERYHQAEDSEIEIIDTKAERKKRGMRGCFSVKLIQHIRETLKDGGQVIILRSRRAWSTAMQCESCGEIVKCPHCNVSLSLHKVSGNMAVCHYCGYRTQHTGSCSKCGGNLNMLGAGTQRIEDEAAALFPEARISRLDSDTAQSRTYETNTIRDFADRKIDILIGTQIVTKGFDFSGVRLVAVIAADSLLGIQDFRADEKAVHILEQFRGRCGRRGSKGTLVIQTSQPEHPVYQSMVSGGPSVLSVTLLQERKDFSFPPFTRIIEVTVRDTSEDRAIRMSRRLGDSLNAALAADGVMITGPYAPAVDRIAGHHIRAIRISLRKDKNLVRLKQAIKDIVNGFEKGSRYDGHITINVDPS